MNADTKQKSVEEFWSIKTPYDVLVPSSVPSIVAIDGANTLFRTGEETEMMVGNPPTKEEWLNLHAVQRDGKWYYHVPSEQTGQ